MKTDQLLSGKNPVSDTDHNPSWLTRILPVIGKSGLAVDFMKITGFRADKADTSLCSIYLNPASDIQ